MLAVFISWVVIFIVLFSMGDILISIYNRVSKSQEKYSVLDTLLLGLCLICILLPLSSFWLPSNHYILLIYLLISILYWVCKRKELLKSISAKLQVVKGMGFFMLFSIIVFSVALLAFVSYLSINADSILYHYQNIFINETYKVIPGIANIEDRFGFNSNYLLVSALFSLRFLFGQSIYAIPSFLFLCICINLFVSMATRRKMIYLVGCFLLILVLITNINMSNTSTDILPNLIVFCYVLNIITNEKDRSNLLFAFIIPIALITFKLSMLPLCIVSFAIFIKLLRNKQMQKIKILFLFSFCILSFWCVRNVIISGYIIYPLSFIDVFSVDWKVPNEVGELQNVFISDWAKIIQYNDYLRVKSLFEGNIPIYKIELLQIIIYPILYVLSLISLAVVIYSKRKHTYANSLSYILFGSLCVCVAFSLIKAPDSRFYIGSIIGVVFQGIYFFLLISGKDKVYLSYLRVNCSSVIVLLMTILVMYKHNKGLTHLFYRVPFDVSKAILYPIDPLERNNKGVLPLKYKLSQNINVYLVDEFSAPLEYTPFTNSGGIPFSSFYGKKIQNVKTIEARGAVIEDGFRTKEYYKSLFHEEIEYFKEEYRAALKEKIKEEEFLKPIEGL